MTAPPWSDRCEPDVRLRALDEMLADLVADGAVPDEAIPALLRANREHCGSGQAYDVARRWLLVLRPGATVGDLMAAAFSARFPTAQLETMGRALRAGAWPIELLTLGVHGGNCEGQDLVALAEEELQQRMTDAVWLGQAGGSQWLRDYCARLVDRWREIRGGHHGDSTSST